MIFGLAGNSIASYVRMRSEPAYARPRTEVAAPVPTTDWEAVTAARQSLARLVTAIDELDTQLAVRTGRGGGTGLTATSAADIGLDPAPATAARTVSTEEVNTTPTSFSPFGPGWTGGSTAELTVGGVYDGSNGTGTLSFESQRNGVRGVDNIKVDVLDSGGKKVDAFVIAPGDPLDTVYTLKNGLTVTVGAGALVKNDTATVDVFHTVGSAPDPDKPFDGVRNDNPNLEPGLVVSAGSFEINGESITVLASDSINSVLARINASAAGVTATYDAATERVSVVQDTPGSVPGIVLANDTSGFLAATKLALATVTPGTDHEPDVALASLAEFAGVTAGTLTINGTPLAIDPASDSLNGIIARINASGAGVTASLSGDAQRVTIAAPSGAARMILADDSGLLASIGIAAREYLPEGRGSGVSKARSYRIADAVESVSRALDRLFRDGAATGVSGMDALRGGLRGAFAGYAGESAREAEGFGLHLAVGPTDGLLPFDVQDRRRLTKQLQRDLAPVRELLRGDPAAPESGLLGRLRAVVEIHRAGLGLTPGSTGTLLSRFA